MASSVSNRMRGGGLNCPNTSFLEGVSHVSAFREYFSTVQQLVAVCLSGYAVA